jgi:hypothetical protein
LISELLWAAQRVVLDILHLHNLLLVVAVVVAGCKSHFIYLQTKQSLSVLVLLPLHLQMILVLVGHLVSSRYL